MTEAEKRAVLSILANKARKVMHHENESIELTGMEFIALWKMLKDLNSRVRELEKS